MSPVDLWYGRAGAKVHRRKRKHFTLVELMTVVALLMVLAAIALPNFHEAQMKARFSEVLPNTNAILDAQIAYQMATNNNSIALTDTNPMGYGRQRQPWLANTYFDAIEFEPDGEVYASYFFAVHGATSTICDDTEPSGLAALPNRVLYATAHTDLDGSGLAQAMACCESHPVSFFNASQFGRCGTLYVIGQQW